MHGIIFHELEKYVVHNLGPGAWKTLLSRAELAATTFTVFHNYPDEHAMRLVSLASELTGTPIPTLLEDFGRFIAPGLLKFTLLGAGWRTLDVLEHTEKTIHSVVRQSGGEPPKLKVERLALDRASIVYTSSRRLCALAMGIVFGLADYFEEEITAEQSQCMLEGAERCEITVVSHPRAT